MVGAVADGRPVGDHVPQTVGAGFDVAGPFGRDSVLNYANETPFIFGAVVS